MSSSSSDSFIHDLDLVKSSVQVVADHVNCINEKFPSALVELEEKLSAIDYAQLNACLAFTIASIYFTYLRVRGVDHTEHPIAQELERVKSYMKKIIQIRQAQESGEIPQDLVRPMIDSEVAERVVRFYTASNSALEQRKKRRTDSTCNGPEENKLDAISQTGFSEVFPRSLSDVGGSPKRRKVSRGSLSSVVVDLVSESSSETQVQETIPKKKHKMAEKKRKEQVEQRHSDGPVEQVFMVNNEAAKRKKSKEEKIDIQEEEKSAIKWNGSLGNPSKKKKKSKNRIAMDESVKIKKKKLKKLKKQLETSGLSSEKRKKIKSTSETIVDQRISISPLNSKSPKGIKALLVAMKKSKR